MRACRGSSQSSSLSGDALVRRCLWHVTFQQADLLLDLRHLGALLLSQRRLRAAAVCLSHFGLVMWSE